MSDQFNEMMSLFAMIDETPRKSRSYARGAFHYLGSKDRSLTFILEHIPKREGFCEVFGGSGIVLLNRARSNFEVYNDRNSGITTYFKCLLDDDKYKRLKEKMKILPHSRELYLDYRDNWFKDDDDVGRAFKYIYTLFKSVNSVRRGFARVKTTKQSPRFYLDIQEYTEMMDFVRDRFLGVLIENLDWRKCIEDFDQKNMVFYLDPPYVGCKDYEFNLLDRDHHEMCDRIFSSKGIFVLSGYANPIYDKFKWSAVHTFKLPNYSSTAEHKSGKGHREECLWIKR